MKVNRMGMTDMAVVRDNKAQSRFELDVEGAVAFANYRLAPSTVIITHTETPRALRGRGIASQLVQGALELIRADGLKIVAGCGFGAFPTTVHCVWWANRCSRYGHPTAAGALYWKCCFAGY